MWYKYNVHALAVIVMGFSTQFSWRNHAFLALMNALLHTISHYLLKFHYHTSSAEFSLHRRKTTFASEQLTFSKRLFMMIRKVVEAQWYCCQSDALSHDRKISWCVVIMEQIIFHIHKDESVYSGHHLTGSKHLSYFSRLNLWSVAL